MLFITNREPAGSIKFKKDQKYKFDLDRNAPSNSVYFCKRDRKNSYTEIGSKQLMSALRDHPAEQIMFYIHGFSNLPEPDIFPRALQLQKYFDKKQKNLVLVVPIIWPCDNDIGIIGDYWDDQKSADKSAFSIARVFEKFMEWRANTMPGEDCIKRINILAHSMGNRVLRESLKVWDKYDLANGVPLLFRNTILMAADIVNESLEENQAGRLISEASRNVTVYYASDDLALRSSKPANLKNKVASRRLGHTGPEDMRKVQSNVYAIDCHNFNTDYDFPKGHSYFLEDDDGNMGKVFEHIFESISSGRVNVDNNADRKKVLG